MELHPFAQMKARGALVDLLPALGKPRLEREVLAEAQQRIEGEMGELERGARQLLMRIERGWVGVIGHAQRLGLGGGEWGAHREWRAHRESRSPRGQAATETSKHGMTLALCY